MSASAGQRTKRGASCARDPRTKKQTKTRTVEDGCTVDQTVKWVAFAREAMQPELAAINTAALDVRECELCHLGTNHFWCCTNCEKSTCVHCAFKHFFTSRAEMIPSANYSEQSFTSESKRCPFCRGGAHVTAATELLSRAHDDTVAHVEYCASAECIFRVAEMRTAEIVVDHDKCTMTYAPRKTLGHHHAIHRAKAIMEAHNEVCPHQAPSMCEAARDIKSVPLMMQHLETCPYCYGGIAKRSQDDLDEEVQAWEQALKNKETSSLCKEGMQLGVHEFSYHAKSCPGCHHGKFFLLHRLATAYTNAMVQIESWQEETEEPEGEDEVDLPQLEPAQ